MPDLGEALGAIRKCRPGQSITDPSKWPAAAHRLRTFVEAVRDAIAAGTSRADFEMDGEFKRMQDISWQSRLHVLYLVQAELQRLGKRPVMLSPIYAMKRHEILLDNSVLCAIVSILFAKSAAAAGQHVQQAAPSTGHQESRLPPSPIPFQGTNVRQSDRQLALSQLANRVPFNSNEAGNIRKLPPKLHDAVTLPHSLAYKWAAGYHFPGDTKRGRPHVYHYGSVTTDGTMVGLHLTRVRAHAPPMSTAGLQAIGL